MTNGLNFGPVIVSSPSARRLFPVFAGILTAIFFFHSLAESRLKSPASDEPPHIASGLSYVATGIFRGNPQHPPLLKELCGLFMMLGGIRWPENPETAHFLRGTLRPHEQPEWGIGNVIIADNGPGRVLFWARLPFVLIASMLAVLIYLWGRQLTGELAALCAVFLYTTDPTIVAHSYTVTRCVRSVCAGCRGCGYEARAGQRAQVSNGLSTVTKCNDVDADLSRAAVESV
jgi:hypothetical protein